jgi:hypothetical protein
MLLSTSYCAITSVLCDFPVLLQLSKLLSVSLGHEVFSIESWERAMQLEQLRKQRLAAAQQQGH